MSRYPGHASLPAERRVPQTCLEFKERTERVDTAVPRPPEWLSQLHQVVSERAASAAIPI